MLWADGRWTVIADARRLGYLEMTTSYFSFAWRANEKTPDDTLMVYVTSTHRMFRINSGIVTGDTEGSEGYLAWAKPDDVSVPLLQRRGTYYVLRVPS